MNNRKRSELLHALEQEGYSRVGDRGSGGNSPHGGCYDYLLRMPVRGTQATF